jgi:anthranilate/para-aminobenzoate synthase component I
VPVPGIESLHSNMSRAEYLAHAGAIIARIHAGDLYQANLTRKFGGTFAAAPDGFSLFCRLCELSPGAYSAYLRCGDTHIISSSPELFLSIDAAGRMLSEPIKGSAPRGASQSADLALRRSLEESGKDRAENLMIVDLMRHDFSRVCEPGSVQVPALFTVTSHASIHHLSSRIVGKKRRDCTTLAALQACFPPGSMTGAPKIRAMEQCSAAERDARGVYSGAIGWLGGDGSAHLSVVIRTLLVEGRRFEFQAGGGVVADSTPEAELSELLDKTRGIAELLGISRAALAAL